MNRATRTRGEGEVVDDEPARAEVVDDERRDVRRDVPKQPDARVVEVVDDEPARGGVVDDEPRDEPRDVPRHPDARRRRCS
jgi:hypothetical protein